MSDKRQTLGEKVISKILVGFAYYQTKFDIKIPYALFEIQPDTGWFQKRAVLTTRKR